MSMNGAGFRQILICYVIPAMVGCLLIGCSGESRSATRTLKTEEVSEYVEGENERKQQRREERARRRVQASIDRENALLDESK